ncbi:hypothetical protein OS493_008657 [Desmophyllum pertusum]|uniref:Secreted protein n=1 Tax=Desmophyllum pertusum TaxID=174260 RepID=A0A9W9ZRG8_9CNID|nr:hypothetical protein OS493_008657 [Desmophyllum pertusum]
MSFFSPKPTYRKSVHTFLCFLLPLPDSLLSLKSTCYVERRACSRQHYILRNDCNMISQRYFNEGRWPKFRHRNCRLSPRFSNQARLLEYASRDTSVCFHMINFRSHQECKLPIVTFNFIEFLLPPDSQDQERLGYK